MGVFKRGKNWGLRYTDPNSGKLVRKVIGPNKRVAESCLAKIKVEIAEGRYLDKKEQLQPLPFTEFKIEYLDHSKTNKKSWKRDVVSIKRLQESFGDMPMQEITPLMIERHKSQRRKMVKPSTINKPNF